MADNPTPWTMLWTELVGFLGDGGNPTQFSGLQIVPTRFTALWDNPVWGRWRGFEIADNIPMWGPIYEPSLDKRVTIAYFSFLSNVDAQAQDDNAANQAKQLREPMSAALDQIQSARDQLVTEWRNFSASHQGQQNFDQWFAQNWQPRLSTLENDYQNLAAQWVTAANKAGGGYTTLAQAMSDYNNPAFQVQAIDDTGTKLPYRTWNLVPRLTDFIQQAKAGQGTPLALQIDSHTSTGDINIWGADAKADFDIGFLEIGTEGSFQRITVDTTTQDFAMSFSAKAFASIQISAGRWFHQDVVIAFQKGPFITNTVFFSPNGVYNLMANTLYVAYQPSVTATVDALAYSKLKQSWNARSDVSIGPFSFSSDLAGSTDTAVFSDMDRSATFTSNSQHPQVIAVNCTIMPGS